MEDRQIVDLYFERSESAITETDKKYGRYCKYIAQNILGDEEAAKEIVNDTYLKVWRTVPPSRPDCLKGYVGCISRQLAINRAEVLGAKKRDASLTLVLSELSDCIPDTASELQIGESLALRDALNRFVGSLPIRTRQVFVRRYFYASPLAEIAQAYSMRQSSVSVLLLRTRRKLKTFLEKEGFDL